MRYLDEGKNHLYYCPMTDTYRARVTDRMTLVVDSRYDNLLDAAAEYKAGQSALSTWRYRVATRQPQRRWMKNA